jgi:hypothetical protein
LEGDIKVNECRFLSTFSEKVLCFESCAFYNYEGIKGACPFKEAYFNREKYYELQNSVEKDYRLYFNKDEVYNV